VVKLFMSADVTVTENFLLVRQGKSGLDISDDFGFNIDVTIPLVGGFPPSVFEADATIRQMIDMVRPAHTLYRIRYIFRDTYIPTDPSGKIVDAMRWAMLTYNYDDFRSYWAGLRDRDRLGRKTNTAVSAEDHSGDF
jgi:hypothetical protein